MGRGSSKETRIKATAHYESLTSCSGTDSVFINFRHWKEESNSRHIPAAPDFGPSRTRPNRTRWRTNLCTRHEFNNIFRSCSPKPTHNINQLHTIQGESCVVLFGSNEPVTWWQWAFVPGRRPPIRDAGYNVPYFRMIALKTCRKTPLVRICSVRFSTENLLVTRTFQFSAWFLQ